MKISFLLRVCVLSVCLLIWGSSHLLAADMTRLINRDCTRCHKNDLSKLEKTGGQHAVAVACQDCHLSHPKQRGSAFEVVDCTSCHDPEDSKHFTIGNCTECHHAHWPLEIDLDQFEKPLKQICLSCHDNPYGQGSTAHSAGLRCTECHSNHNSVPSCTDCHEGHTDGSVEEPCLSCHAAHNPLPPLEAEGLTTKLCTACHAKTTQAMAASEALHAQMSCDECHVQHKDQPDCLNCHEGHNPKMQKADCAGCHGYHEPMPPLINAGVNTAYCSDCHEGIGVEFDVAGAAHKENLSCADCHTTHPPADVKIADCSSCHNKEDNSHYALEGCTQCHNPHSPKTENLDLTQLETARPFCVSCHDDVIDVMEKQPTAHSDAVDCNACHSIHGQSPSCFDCHEGHTEEMTADDCTKCHNHHAPAPVTFTDDTFSDYCVSCHEEAFNALNIGGRAHKELACVDCHQAHPPAENAIPECSSCHAVDDNEHFSNPNCVGCHDPHQPLKDDISGFLDSRPVCSGCHEDVEADLTSGHPSAHDRDCVACHRTHIGVPSCLGCHNGHDKQMTNEDCALCHDAHAPLQIDLTAEPPSQQCSACHQDISAEVDEKGGAHRDAVECSSCHQQHPESSCTSCHAEHPQRGVGIPETCFGCHNPSDHEHYTVGDCQSCHSPHQPLVLTLKDYKPHAPVCVSCHEQVESDFAEMPSAHSEQDCTSCHSNHTTTRICLDCHDGHDKSMKREDCALCHLPHQPQNISLHKDAKIPTPFCASCHQDQAAAFDTKGAAHKKDLDSCVACHPEHKPNVKTVESCNSCHPKARRRHFVLENCAGCHDPHQPLEMDLGKLGEVKPVCLSCHNNQERLHQQYPNKHTSFDCSECHVGEHGSSKQCLDCHEPHIPDMTMGDCLKCHPPHLPHMIKARPTQAGPVCASCHEDATANLKENGAKHSKQPCISCHRTHPPFGEDVIPSCISCHEPDEGAHFTVGNCEQCHEAHEPLGRDLSKAENVNPACESCHSVVAETFATTPNLHAEQDCNSCHPKHAVAQKCAECHEPHTPDMDYAACLSCHNAPHAPNIVAFGASIPSGHCQSCHSDQVEALSASEAAHNQMNCVACHGGEHGNAMRCVDCHEQPHDEGLHQKFPDCLTCHGDPHDLADWRGQPEKQEPVPEEQAEDAIDNPAAEPAASSEGQ